MAVVVAFVAVSAVGQTSSAGMDTIKQFENRANDYVKFREKVDWGVPKLPKKATKEQIQVHRDALLQSVQMSRSGAKQGDIFTPEASVLIRQMMKDEFKGRDRADLRKRVFEVEGTIKVKVNIAYPQSIEIVDMPPQLLLTLPQLPKELKYRLVATYLLLVDRENDLIIDYMTDALP